MYSLSPSAPGGRIVARQRGGRAFITQEPDGLFYVWWKVRADGEAREHAVWTYAFRHKSQALRQMRGKS